MDIYKKTVKFIGDIINDKHIYNNKEVISNENT